MKHSLLILISVLAVSSVEAFRQHAPPRPQFRDISDSSDESSISSEADSFEDNVVQNKNTNQQRRIDPDMMIQAKRKFNEAPLDVFGKKKNTFFDRPSSEELEAYDDKVRQQKMNRFVEDDEPIMIQGPVDPEFARGPKPKTMKPKMDDAEEKVFLTALGQIYLDKLDEEQRTNERYPGPLGPIGPMGPPPPLDYDYLFVPVEAPSKMESNNNGNNNVHVNVNHVQVNSNVLHVPEKDKKNIEKHEDMPPIIPSYHDSEPSSTSQFLYFNFNTFDILVLSVLIAAFVFATKKAYTKCFPKKNRSSAIANNSSTNLHSFFYCR